ncbi:MAG: Fe-S cluster assembly protein SufD, partial [Methylocystis sp.]
VRIAAGAHIERPIAIVNMIGAGVSAFTRNVVIVGEGARATIVEVAMPIPDGAQENCALTLSLGAGARVEHIGDFCFGQPTAVRVYSLLATLAEDSFLNSTALIWGGGLTRRQVFAKLGGARAEARFNGAMLLAGRDHADTTLLLEHDAPNGKSRERFRAIVDDEATGVFQGKVSVAQAAQKTDGSMQSKALLLSSGATMNNKPELEIFADDVVCGHGATCGRLDAEQLFYLMARGLPRDVAEALLIEGFASEAMTEIEHSVLREEMTAKISAWLTRRKLRSEGDAT